MTLFARVISELKSNTLAWSCFWVVAFLFSMAVYPGFFTKMCPTTVMVCQRLETPSLAHILGTDGVGRDVFCCIVYGARATFLVIILSTVLAIPMGVLLGMLAGYAGPRARNFILRFTDVFLSFPRLVLAMMVPVLIGHGGLSTTVISLAFTLWPAYTRLACIETMRVRDMPFVHFAILQGAGSWYLFRVHLLPFIIPSAVVRFTTDCSLIVLTAASLSFLGVGISPDTPEWGAIAAQGREFLFTHSWIALAPGFAIFLLSFSFQIIGDVIRDALDPKEK